MCFLPRRDTLHESVLAEHGVRARQVSCMALMTAGSVSCVHMILLRLPSHCTAVRMWTRPSQGLRAWEGKAGERALLGWGGVRSSHMDRHVLGSLYPSSLCLTGFESASPCSELEATFLAFWTLILLGSKHSFPSVGAFFVRQGTWRLRSFQQACLSVSVSPLLQA